MPKELPPKISKAGLDATTMELVTTAKQLYLDKLSSFCLGHKPPAFIVAAPGRVNLIGEHTDYTGGFVMPLALSGFSTIVYGTGTLQTGKGAGSTSVRLRMVSSNIIDQDGIEEREWAGDIFPPTEDEPRSWVNYVVGTIVQYLPDLPKQGTHLELAFAVSSNIPLGAGLSSSAALEVATATFLECYLHDFAFSSQENPETTPPEVERALRCQRAENEWAYSPCGIMDQLASSAAKKGHLMLIDCRNLEIQHVPMKKGAPDEDPVIVIANSKVEHSIADGEYGKRRYECNDALEAMQQVPLYHVLTLRDATLQDVKDGQAKMESETIFKRARHVVTENSRTKECKTAWKLGMWTRVGELMNASHASLRDDYEVSCKELDCLVDAAQKFEGVYGSRLTGGGFGGCTVTLVKKSQAAALMDHLKQVYKEQMELDCDCFITEPGDGARALAIDMDCKKAT